MMRVVFFFEQMTAYELRISDWSSDVCSSDLLSAYAYARPFHCQCSVPVSTRLVVRPRSSVQSSTGAPASRAQQGFVDRQGQQRATRFVHSLCCNAIVLASPRLRTVMRSCLPPKSGANSRISSLAVARLEPLVAGIDRKSTRLNSSH